jgi:hypothetical protein
MANDSRVNLKMLFTILTDKEIEELQKEPSGGRISTPQICCGGKQMSDPSRSRSRFSRRLRAAKTPASCWAVAASWKGANGPVGLPPLDGAND